MATIAIVATLFVLSPAYAVTSRLTVSAGKSSCPAGYVCLWQYSNFQGPGYAFFNSEINYATLPSPFNNINNNSYSFYNHGYAGAYEDVRFHRGTGQSGDNFVLCKSEAISHLPSNGDVDPPTTTTPGRGWRDQISSHKWGDFC